MSESEREQAIRIANQWLDFKMNSLVQMVPGDPDCDACVVARQLLRALERLGECGQMSEKLGIVDGYEYEVDIVSAQDADDTASMLQRKLDGWEYHDLSMSPYGYLREIWKRRVA
jgi:hypothetical protein